MSDLRHNYRVLWTAILVLAVVGLAQPLLDTWMMRSIGLHGEPWSPVLLPVLRLGTLLVAVGVPVAVMLRLRARASICLIAGGAFGFATLVALVLGPVCYRASDTCRRQLLRGMSVRLTRNFTVSELRQMAQAGWREQEQSGEFYVPLNSPWAGVYPGWPRPFLGTREDGIIVEWWVQGGKNAAGLIVCPSPTAPKPRVGAASLALGEGVWLRWVGE